MHGVRFSGWGNENALLAVFCVSQSFLLLLLSRIPPTPRTLNPEEQDVRPGGGRGPADAALGLTVWGSAQFF